MCHHHLRVTNQLAVLPTQAPKGDNWEHRCLIMLVTSPLEVKLRFRDLDMVRFPAPYIDTVTSVLLSPSVYYRIYSPTSGVEIKNPEFPEDPYLGCSLAIRIPPPHIADSVKCHICWREDISDHKNTKLFTDISCLSTPLDDYEPVHILDHSGVGSTTGDPVALVILEPGSTGYQYKLKANLDCKVNDDTSGPVSDMFCSVTSVDTRNPGWLLYRKGDILHTNGVPIKGEASCFRSKVHQAAPHTITFQTHILVPMMVFAPQMILHKLVVVRINLLFPINWT